MKKVFKIGLAVVLSFLASQLAFAQIGTFGGKTGDFNIHFTTVLLSNPDNPVNLSASLYYGEKNGLLCVPLRFLATFAQTVSDGFQIGAPASIFNDLVLNNKSCAVEKYFVDGGERGRIEYMLINDGKKILFALPQIQTIKFKS